MDWWMNGLIDEELIPETILYGTGSGNAARLAKKTGKAFRSRGACVRVASLQEVSPWALPDLGRLLFYVSTWGDGDPPPSAESFCRELRAAQHLDLRGMRFGMVALGDSCFPNFCGCGKEVACRLEEAGAVPIFPTVCFDVDFFREFPQFLKWLMSSLSATSEDNRTKSKI